MSSQALQCQKIDPSSATSKTVFFRADLNVPMVDGQITDKTRINRSASGIRALAEAGAKTVVSSHYGRPKGRNDPALSLAPIAPALEEAIGRPVKFVEYCVGDEAENTVGEMHEGDVVLLENLRFHKGEEKNDLDFAQSLAKFTDIYVNDAFSASHRAHASVDALARLKKDASYTGPLMAEELAFLTAALENPIRPLVAIVGGAKISTKMDVLTHLVEKTDTLIIGGGMANSFLAAQGIAIGASLVEADMLGTAAQIMRHATAQKCQLILPDSVVVASALVRNAPHRSVNLGEGVINPDEMILDVGDSTIDAAKNAIASAKTLIWNGPMGAFETPPFDRATVALAEFVAEQTKQGRLTSIAGGGDTVAALNHAGVADDLTYVSTAGGAFLEWIEGKELPALSALLDK